MKTRLLFILLTASLVACKQGGVECESGDCENGKGKQVRASGQTYEGQFKNGKPHGAGVMYNELFDMTTTAIWKDGELNGLGVEQHGPTSSTPNARFEGAWKNGRKEGQGVWIYGDIDPDFPGEKYVGDFKDGFMTGKGRYTWPNGAYAEGDFVAELLHGEGMCYWPDDDDDEDNTAQTYIGEFKYDMRDGYGVVEWETGEKYEGYWLEDEFHGEGKYSWPDGDSFEGVWEYGECEEFDDYIYGF